MIFSSDGLEFIKREESCKLKAYLDEAGIPTIGWGSIRLFGGPVRLDMVISQATADELLDEECNGIASKLEQILIKYVNQNQLDALISFCYNVGVQGFKTSTLLRSINSGGVVLLDYFTRWDKFHRDGMLLESRGLKMRRIREFNLYIRPIED